MGAFFGMGTASASEAPVPPMGTLAGGGSTGPIVTPPAPAVADKPVQMAAAPSTIAGGSAPVAAPAAPSADMTAQTFDTRFKGTPLEGKWDVIKSTAESRGVPPALAAAVMAHETGYGKNVKGNNPAGLMDPATKMQTKQQFPTIERGIDAAVGTIAKNYNAAGGDLGRMAQRYAPVGAANDKSGLNKDWLPGVKKIAAQFGGI